MEGIRDLTHAQIKELRKAGLDSATAGKPQTEEEAALRGAQLIDWIIENVYGDLAEAGTPYWKLRKLALETYQRAYGDPEEIKNS